MKESDLLQLIDDKDTHAFDLLSKQYGARLLTEIKKCTTDKNLHDIIFTKSMAKIQQTISLYDRTKSSLYAWMLDIAIKQCDETFHLHHPV